MNCKKVQINTWYYGFSAGSGRKTKIYITSNSRNEGPKGFYVRAGAVGYGVIKVESINLEDEVDELDLFEANQALSRTNNQACQVIAKEFFLKLKGELSKSKRNSFQNLFPQNPSYAIKTLAYIVIASITALIAACLFL